MPAKLEERRDKLRKDFLLLGNKERKGIHLVKWQTAQLRKILDGLGIKNLGLLNKCLLSKWLWRFIKEEHALWKEVVINKYGQSEQWVANMVTNTCGVSVWRSIRNLGSKLAENLSFKVGEGTKIFFWKDEWLGQESLKDAFPNLFSCDNPGATNAETLSPQGWNLTFRRLLNDWEVDRVAVLL